MLSNALNTDYAYITGNHVVNWFAEVPKERHVTPNLLNIVGQAGELCLFSVGRHVTR